MDGFFQWVGMMVVGWGSLGLVLYLAARTKGYRFKESLERNRYSDDTPTDKPWDGWSP